jgi:hypothetical protein
VPAEGVVALDAVLATLVYPCVEVADNPVYRLFLR